MKKVFENEFLSIDLVGENYPFVTMQKKGIVIVMYDEYDNLYLVEKERLGKMALECIRGFGDTVDDVKTYSALRPNIQVLKSVDLGTLQADTGIMNNEVSVVGMEICCTETALESMKLVRLNKAEIFKAIAKNEITCGYTLSALMKYCTLQ